MARMLQALKNLEARSPAKPAPKPPPQSAPKPKSPPQPAVVELEASPPPANRSVEPSKPPRVSPAMPPVTESIEALAGHLASLEISVQDPPGRFELGRVMPTPVSTPAVATPPSVAAVPTAIPAATPAPPPRTVCEIERRIQRTLSDTMRAKPLVDLTARLCQDMEQTAAKTLTFVGIGQSATHEALLCVATLLARQSSGKVLLIDGDVDGRTLSDVLEYGRERGLSELLQGNIAAADVCRVTAVEKLAFLPAGLSPLDLSAAGAQWGKVLEHLVAEFNCVLVDLGRASDSAASTLARIADATYLVVQLGIVETSEAQSALADFRAAGARVLGCIAT